MQPDIGPHDLTLDGQVAIVTGASRGIGQAIAVAYAQAGARVALVARTEEALAETAASIDPTGERVETIVADVSDPTAGERILAATLAKFGSVDTLVNNAGIQYDTPFLETSAEDWSRIIDINLTAVVNLTREVGRELVRQKSGSVLNVSSAWAHKTLPSQSAYITSKAALTQFTRVLSREWARHNVRVNSLAPGYFATEITREGINDEKIYDLILKSIPQRRVAEPVEIGPIAVFLASPAAAYVTGADFAIDGGMGLT